MHPAGLARSSSDRPRFLVSRVGPIQSNVVLVGWSLLLLFMCLLRGFGHSEPFSHSVIRALSDLRLAVILLHPAGVILSLCLCWSAYFYVSAVSAGWSCCCRWFYVFARCQFPYFNELFWRMEMNYNLPVTGLRN